MVVDIVHIIDDLIQRTLAWKSEKLSFQKITTSPITKPILLT